MKTYLPPLRSACSGTAAGQLPVTPALAGFRSAPACSHLSLGTAGAPSPDETCQPTVTQQTQLQSKTITVTGKKDIGEMMIEVPEHRDQAVNMSSDSLGRTDPLYFNFNCNFDLSANNSDGDGTAAAEEPQALGPGAQSGEGFARLGSELDAWHTHTHGYH